MTGRLVAAQIGCGFFAEDQHGPNLVRNENVNRIKWACDVSDDNAAHFAERFGAEKTTRDFREAVADPEVDIILIATSHEIHLPIIELAAESGKHIFCEKPMAVDEEEARKIIRVVRKGKVKLCVDYMRRMAPAMIALKREWLAHRAAPAHHPWRPMVARREKYVEETGTDFLIRIQDESSSYRTVHLDPARGGGLIIGEAVHWLDLASWLFEDDRPVEVLAWGSVRMRFGIRVVFESGNEATIVMTPNGTFDYPKEMCEIACDGALFRMEHFVENQYYGRPGLEREVFRLQRDPQPEIGVQGGLSGFLEKYKSWVTAPAAEREGHLRLYPDKGHEAIFDGFVDAVLNDTATPCDETAGRRATLLAELAIGSIENNAPVRVPKDKWEYLVEECS